jgi:hypothetical protein
MNHDIPTRIPGQPAALSTPEMRATQIRPIANVDEKAPPPADVRSGEASAPRPANGEGLTPIATLEAGTHEVSVAIFESAVRGRSVELTINHPRSRRPFVMHLYRGEASALAAHLLRASEQILGMRGGDK